MWDAHGVYTDSLVAGIHDYLFLPPEASGRGGLARHGSSPPSNAHQVTAKELRDRPPDVVLLQRLEEIDLCAGLLGLRPGREMPAVFLEHNTPKTDVPSTRHPLADEPGVLIVRVTHFNDVLWDCGRTRTRVIEHGVADPGPALHRPPAAIGVRGQRAGAALARHRYRPAGPLGRLRRGRVRHRCRQAARSIGSRPRASELRRKSQSQHALRRRGRAPGLPPP
jgi:hypothetical protein